MINLAFADVAIRKYLKTFFNSQAKPQKNLAAKQGSSLKVSAKPDDDSSFSD